MSNSARELMEAVLALPEPDRAEMAARLIDSLDAEIDPDCESAWQQEVQRRAEDLATGSVRPVPWSEARRRIAGADNASA